MNKVFFEFVKVDFILLLRGKIGMFWTLGFPAAMLILQMSLFGNNAALGPVNLQIVNLDNSPQSKAYTGLLSDALKRQTSIRVKLDIHEKNRPEKFDILLIIPSDFGKRIEAGNNARISWEERPLEKNSLNAMRGMLLALTDSYNIELIGKTRPVSLNIQNQVNPASQDSYILYLATGLAGMIILSTSLMGFGPVLVAAREAGMFKLYQMFPIERGSILLAWWFSRLLLSFFASILMFGVAMLFYHLRIDAGLLQIVGAILLFILGAGTFLALGIVIAAFSRSVTMATMAANFLYFPLLFSGNVMVPVNGLPEPIRELLSLFPLNTLVGNLRALLGNNVSQGNFIYAIILFAVLLMIAFWVAKNKFTWQPRD